MEVRVNGFKYSALYSGVIFAPTVVPSNFAFAVRSSISIFNAPEDNYVCILA
jgi:hypothetical protein